MRSLYAEGVGVPIGGGPLAAVFIGASTGGPRAVRQVLAALPEHFPAPIAVCQHMSEGFTAGWAERLDAICQVSVKMAAQGQEFEPGVAYIAPAGRHMRVQKDGSRVIVRLLSDFADSFHVPSIDYLFSSAADAYGSRALGVLMTGIGSDGALGMLAIRRSGGHTIAESRETAAAYGMPGSAVELGAAAEEVPLSEIARVVCARVAGRLTD